MGRKDAKDYMKSMFARQQGRRRSSDSSDLDSSDDDSWRRGMSGTEYMVILASVSINHSESNIEFKNNDLKRYKKQAKRWSKKQRH